MWIRLKEWHPVEEVIGVALGLLERLLGDRPVSVDVPAGLMIRVDDVLFEQLLWNVLENAGKYAPAGSPILVSAHAHNGGVTIEVADAGPGFAPGRRIWFGTVSIAAAQREREARAWVWRFAERSPKRIVAASTRRTGQGGALIRIMIPDEGTPPELPDA